MPLVVGRTVVAFSHGAHRAGRHHQVPARGQADNGGPLSSPAAAYGRVYAIAPAAGTLAAYDLTNRQRLWSVPSDATGPPSVANGVVYATGPTGLHA